MFPKHRATTRRQFLAAAAALGLAHRASSESQPHGPYIDGLSFLPERLDDVRASELDAFICDVSAGEMDVDANGHPFYHRTFKRCDESIDAALARVRSHPSELRLALTGDDTDRGTGAAVIFQFQGCEPIGTDLSRIEHFHSKALRILQLTHNETNAFATAYTDERSNQGLTALGHDGVIEMNRLGVIADVSHASERTTLDVARVSKASIILSHGACRALVPHPRCATDAMIRAVADSGGIFGVFMMSFWLTQVPVPTVEHFVAQIRHAIRVGGLDAVGIANDNPMAGLMTDHRPFDNERDTAKTYGDWWQANRKLGRPGFSDMPRHAVIPELNNIERMPRIHRALLQAGFRPSEADRIMGGNWRRFFKTTLR
jgi:microsomal dipeptidase-like Zn-dependent dipeptidase